MLLFFGYLWGRHGRNHYHRESQYLINPPTNAQDLRDVGSIPESGRRKWQLTSVFLPGESHGHRSLESYGP